MKCNTRKQSKLRTVMLAPIKFVCKATQFYSKCMEECNGKMGHGGVALYPVFQPTPRNFSANFTYSRGSNYDDEETQKLLRSVAIRRTATEEESKREMGKQFEVTQTSSELQSDIQRSYSVRVGKLGRIDENEPCCFNEEDHLLYSRSKNSAASKYHLYQL